MIDHADFLKSIFAKNKALYGGWRMELEEDAPAENADETPADEAPVEEPNEGEGNDDADEDEGDEPKSFDAAYVSRLRSESANWRTKFREAERALAERKSDEDVEVIVNGMRNDFESSERALVVENAALRHKLPEDLQDTLSKLAEAGLSKDEIDAQAKTLAKFTTRRVLDDADGGLNPGGEPNDNTNPRERVREIRRTRF